MAKQSLTVGDWIKVIFSDELQISTGQSNGTETFVWYHYNEFQDDYLKKTKLLSVWYSVACTVKDYRNVKIYIKM